MRLYCCAVPVTSAPAALQAPTYTRRASLCRQVSLVAGSDDEEDEAGTTGAATSSTLKLHLWRADTMAGVWPGPAAGHACVSLSSYVTQLLALVDCAV